MKLNYPSISQFQQFVELKDYRPPTKKEYLRNVCKLAEHFQCDPATLTENQQNQLRECDFGPDGVPIGPRGQRRQHRFHDLQSASQLRDPRIKFEPNHVGCYGTMR